MVVLFRHPLGVGNDTRPDGMKKERRQKRVGEKTSKVTHIARIEPRYPASKYSTFTTNLREYPVAVSASKKVISIFVLLHQSFYFVLRS